MIKYEGDYHKSIKVDGIKNDEILCLNAYFHEKVEISNCIFSKLRIIGSNFYSGLYIKKCIIENFACFESGGYNQKPIQIIDTKFNTLFDIMDCNFENLVALKSVDFLKGISLFGNIGTPYENDFEIKPVLENVTGKLDIKTYKY